MPAPTVFTSPPVPRPATRPGEHYWWCWECAGPDQRWRRGRDTDWEHALDRHLAREHGARP